MQSKVSLFAIEISAQQMNNLVPVLHDQTEILQRLIQGQNNLQSTDKTTQARINAKFKAIAEMAAIDNANESLADKVARAQKNAKAKAIAEMTVINNAAQSLINKVTQAQINAKAKAQAEMIAADQIATAQKQLQNDQTNRSRINAQIKSIADVKK